MCTEINMVDLVTIHHEQGKYNFVKINLRSCLHKELLTCKGHIQYDQQYKTQPITFRDGANPGIYSFPLSFW